MRALLTLFAALMLASCKPPEPQNLSAPITVNECGNLVLTGRGQ